MNKRVFTYADVTTDALMREYMKTRNATKEEIREVNVFSDDYKYLTRFDMVDVAYELVNRGNQISQEDRIEAMERIAYHLKGELENAEWRLEVYSKDTSSGEYLRAQQDIEVRKPLAEAAWSMVEQEKMNLQTLFNEAEVGNKLSQ